MKINDKIILAEEALKTQFKKLEDIALYNQNKIMNAFQNNKVALRHFVGSTGYGYDDIGRDTLAKVFAECVGAQQAIVSPALAGASHALKVALYGMLRPGDTLLSITGKPYETLDEVIFGNPNKDIGSLKDFKVSYQQIELNGSDFNYDEIEKQIKQNPKLIFIQRSRGYFWRDALSIEKIEKIINFIRKFNKSSYIMVDNCYCEFTQTKEPTDVGANIIVGSFMKNPGGGLAPNGAYIAGDSDCIDWIAGAFTSPSLKLEIGSYEAGYRLFFQGLFMAAHTTLQALKSSMLFGKVLQDIGYKVLPKAGEDLYDITRSIELGNKEDMIQFCKAIQHSAPVDSFLIPEPCEMPGYKDPIIMAAGSFVQGASIELSCDGPVKPPYIIYMQGALTYEQAKLALNKCLVYMNK